MKALNIRQLSAMCGGTTFVASFQVPGSVPGMPGSLTPIPIVFRADPNDLLGTLIPIAILSKEAAEVVKKNPGLVGLMPPMVITPAR